MQILEKPLSKTAFRNLFKGSDSGRCVVAATFGEIAPLGQEALNDFLVEKIVRDRAYALEDLGFMAVGSRPLRLPGAHKPQAVVESGYLPEMEILLAVSFDPTGWRRETTIKMTH